MTPTQRLWFGLMPPGGTANIFIEMFVRRNRRIKFVETCPLSVKKYSNEYSWLYNKYRVPYVEKIENNSGVSFRSVDWIKNSKIIFENLEQYYPNSMWFATFNTEMFKQIKNHIPSCFSVALNYDNEHYEFMVNKWIKWQIGLIMESSLYADTKKSLHADPYQIEHYLKNNLSKDFGYRLPKSRTADGDLNIDLINLYNKKYMKKISKQLKTFNTKQDWEFFDLVCKITS